jgi:hypothetical protein
MPDDNLAGLNDGINTDARDLLFARLVAETFRLAAGRFPDMIQEALRAALHDLHDYRAAEIEAKETREDVRMMRGECKALFEALHRDMGDLEKRTDRINERLNQAARAFNELAKRYAALAQGAK